MISEELFQKKLLEQTSLLLQFVDLKVDTRYRRLSVLFCADRMTGRYF